MDLVSGAEVPAEEIVVTPAMREAGCVAAHVFLMTLSEQVSEICRAMERVRRAEDICECGDPRCPLGGEVGRQADDEMIRAEDICECGDPRCPLGGEVGRQADDEMIRRANEGLIDRLISAGDRILDLMSRCSDQVSDEVAAEHARSMSQMRLIWGEAKEMRPAAPPPGYRNASEDEPERTPPPRGKP